MYDRISRILILGCGPELVKKSLPANSNCSNTLNNDHFSPLGQRIDSQLQKFNLEWQSRVAKRRVILKVKRRGALGPGISRRSADTLCQWHRRNARLTRPGIGPDFLAATADLLG
jgi:hypothetical protein